MENIAEHKHANFTNIQLGCSKQILDLELKDLI